MKLKLSQLNPNPFKKEINEGKLNEEILAKIQSNIKELGLMGSLPVFMKDGEYFLISGHHRAEALKREFGENFEVEITVHKYSNENVLRGMVIENLTQRSDELLEATENLAAIKRFLLRKAGKPEETKYKRGGRGTIKQVLPGSVHEIARWLNSQGEIMSISKIHGYLKIRDNLDPELLKKTFKTEGGYKQVKDSITVEEAKYLSKFKKEDQKVMKEILDATGVGDKEKGKLVTEFLTSSKEMQEKVKNGEINMKDVPLENLRMRIQNKIKAQKEKDKGKIVITHYNQFLREAGNRIGETNDKILQTCLFLNNLEKTGVLYELDLKTMLKILRMGAKQGEGYNKFMDKILERMK